MLYQDTRYECFEAQLNYSHKKEENVKDINKDGTESQLHLSVFVSFFFPSSQRRKTQIILSSIHL